MNPLPLVLLLLLCLNTSSCVATAQASPEPLAPRQSLRVTSYDQRQVVRIDSAARPRRPLTVRDRPAHMERKRHHKAESHADDPHRHKTERKAKRTRHNSKTVKHGTDHGPKHYSDDETKAASGAHEPQPGRHTSEVKKPQHEDPRAERRRDIRARHGARGPRVRGRLHSAPRRACQDLKTARAKQRCEKRAKRNANTPAPAR